MNIICPICKSFIENYNECKLIYIGCSQLLAHKKCIRDNKKDIKLPSSRRSVIKIKYPKGK